MLKKIELSSKFKRSFKRLPSDFQMEFSKRRLLFYRDPFSRQLRTHKLKGHLREYWSFSITYSYRVVFKFIRKDVVLFYDIGDHRIYQ